MARGQPPRAPRWARFQPQVEHGLDARPALGCFARRSRAPSVAPPRPHVRAPYARTAGGSCSPLTRRTCTGRVHFSTRCRATSGSFANLRVVRLDVGLSRRSDALHGRRDRAVGRVERDDRGGLGRARGRAPSGHPGARAVDEPGGEARGRRWVSRTTCPGASSGSTPTTPSTRCTASCAGRPTAPRSWPASPTSRPCRGRLPHRPALGRRWQVLLDTNATYFGGTGSGGARAAWAGDDEPHQAAASAFLTIPPLAVLWLGSRQT